MTDGLHTSRPKAQAAATPVDFVKKVGKGKSLSQDLTFPEAKVAFAALLDGAFLPAQFGAFLQALRIKELTHHELNALAEVFMERGKTSAAQRPAGVAPSLQPEAPTLALNLASDTARKGGLVSLLAAHALSRFGVGVGLVRSEPVLSGNRISFDQSRELAQAVFTASAPQRVDCRDWISGLSALDGLRAQLGFRSCLHTAEKLVNPWPASPLVLGISHKHYALRLAETLQHVGQTGAILLGNHGTVDLVLHKETEMVLIDKAGIRETSVSPQVLGLELSPEIYTLGRFSDWPAWLGLAADGVGAPGFHRDEKIIVAENPLWTALQYHIGVFLWLSGAAEDAAAGLAQARRSLPSPEFLF